MDNLDFFKEILLGVKFELIKFRFLCLGLGVFVLFVVLAVGFSWQDQYVSRAVLEIDDSNIIKPLLRGRAEFADVDRFDEAKSLMGNKQLLQIVATKLNYIDENTGRLELDGVVKSLQSHIVIEPLQDRKNFFSISYSDSDAEAAFEAASVLSEVFVQFQQQSSRVEGEQAYDFITKQADQYKDRLEAAERALQSFKAESLDSNEETVRKRIGELESEIQEIKLGIQESQSKIRSMKGQLDSESEYLDVQSELFTLKRQRATLNERLSELRLQYQDSYPDVVTIEQQIAKLNIQIRNISNNSGINLPASLRSDSADSNPEVLFDELRKQLAVEDVQYRAQTERLASLERLLREEQEKADIVAENQTKAADLMRDYTVTKDVYEEMLSRKENAELSVAIQKDGRGLTFRIVEQASYPFYPSGLTFSHFLVIAPILAIGVPLGLVVGLIILDPRVRTMTNLKLSLGENANLLGVSGHFHTPLGERVMKKDMLVLGVVLSLVVLIYGYVVIALTI